MDGKKKKKKKREEEKKGEEERREDGEMRREKVDFKKMIMMASKRPSLSSVLSLCSRVNCLKKTGKKTGYTK